MWYWQPRGPDVEFVGVVDSPDAAIVDRDGAESFSSRPARRSAESTARENLPPTVEEAAGAAGRGFARGLATGVAVGAAVAAGVAALPAGAAGVNGRAQ